MHNNQTLNYYKVFIRKSKKLKKKEKNILLSRLENKTHREIAEYFNYKSPESIRSKEAKALFRLFRFTIPKD